MSEYLAQLRRFIYREFDPVTKSLILVSGVLYILSLLLSGLNILNVYSILVLIPANILALPWTVITYPLLDNSIFSLIFAILWLWFIGGSLERTWGSKRYGWFLGLVTLITGLAFSVVGFFFAGIGGQVQICGLWTILTGVTWAWAYLNPYQELLVWGMVPVKAHWLAWLQLILTFVSYLQLSSNTFFNLLFALASISGVAVAYFFRSGNFFGRKRPEPDRDTARKRARSRFRVIK